MMMLGGVGAALLIVPAVFLLRPQANAGTAPAHRRGNLLSLMTNPQVLMMALAYLGPAAIFLALLHNIGAFAADLAISQQHAGVVVSATSLMMIAAKFSVGALADRVSHTTLYFTLLTAITVGILLIVGVGNAWALTIGVPIAGLSMGMMPLTAAMIARRFGPEQFGSVMGVILAIASLAGLAPAAAGLLREISGSYASAFTYLLALLIPAVLCFLALIRMPVMAAPAQQPVAA
jgi:MFS family permease